MSSVRPDSLYMSMRAAPDDDQLRLALARRYDNAGDIRGELIRSQVEIASLERCLDELNESERETYDHLVDVEQELLAKYERQWLEPTGLRPTEVQWRRGLPERIRLSWERLQQLHERLHETLPLLYLELSSNDVDPAALADMPLLSKVAGLSLKWRFVLDGDEWTFQLQRLLASDFLGELRELRLGGTPLDEMGMSALIDSPKLTSLRILELDQWDWAQTATSERFWQQTQFRFLHTLNLGGGLCTEKAQSYFLQCTWLARVESLELYEPTASGSDILHLLRRASLPLLRDLTLTVPPVGIDGMASLCASPFFSALHTLRLRSVLLHDTHQEHSPPDPNVRAIQSLVERLPENRLCHLVLSDCQLGEQGARAIASCAHLAQLRRLDLSRNAIGDAGFEAILCSENLTSLRALVAWENQVTAIGFSKGVLGTRGNLRELDVHGNDLGPEAAAALASALGLRSLRKLTISKTNLGDAGAFALAGSTFFSQLRGLDLAQNEISDRGLLALARVEHLGRLRDLCMGGNGFTEEAMRALAESDVFRKLRTLNLLPDDIGFHGLRLLLASRKLNHLRELVVGGVSAGWTGSLDDCAALLADPSVLPGLRNCFVIRSGMDKTWTSLLEPRFGKRP